MKEEKNAAVPLLFRHHRVAPRFPGTTIFVPARPARVRLLLASTVCTATAATTNTTTPENNISRRQPRSQGGECESETLILESVLCATCQHLIGSQLVNSGQLVKVSSQLWSKLQIWLNERGRIGNWTEIKLLIN